MSEVIDMSRIGRDDKPTVKEDFSVFGPGEITYFQYDSGRKTKFSRWVAVNRARTGINLRFTDVNISRVAFEPSEVAGKDGIVAFDCEGKIIYFSVDGGVPFPIKKADVPRLPSNDYFMWVKP